jgi:methionyl-tRNA formyltransferase
VRTVYLGSSVFAVDVLGALAASPHAPVLVITPPDRPRGRGRKTAPPPAAVAARDLGLPVLQAESVNDPAAVAAIAEAAPEVVGVCEFGQLIKQPLLSQYMMLNVHPSLLPRWGGGGPNTRELRVGGPHPAPIERALMAGDPVTGVTIFQLEEGLDSGPVALSRSEAIQPGDTRGTLGERLSALGAALLIEAFDRAEAGALELQPQPEEGVTYAEKIDPAERRLDPARPATELERIVRALTPGIGAYLELEGGERLGVEAARIADAAGDLGEIVVDGGRLFVGCAEGALELLRVRPAGGRSMAAADYLRGHRRG